MNEYIDSLAHVHVAVIGDLMLDCYLHGEVNRISPEAPVPVMRALSERLVPGGAANVAANLAALDVHVHLVGLCGQDEAREQLLGCLAEAGVMDPLPRPGVGRERLIGLGVEEDGRRVAGRDMGQW